jgi:hypothetical protein
MANNKRSKKLIGGIIGGFSILITLIINMVLKKMSQK